MEPLITLYHRIEQLQRSGESRRAALTAWLSAAMQQLQNPASLLDFVRESQARMPEGIGEIGKRLFQSRLVGVFARVSAVGQARSRDVVARRELLREPGPVLAARSRALRDLAEDVKHQLELQR